MFYVKKPHALLRSGRQTWTDSMKNMGMAYISLNNLYHPYNEEVHLNTRAPKTRANQAHGHIKYIHRDTQSFMFILILNIMLLRRVNIKYNDI